MRNNLVAIGGLFPFNGVNGHKVLLHEIHIIVHKAHQISLIPAEFRRNGFEHMLVNIFLIIGRIVFSNLSEIFVVNGNKRRDDFLQLFIGNKIEISRVAEFARDKIFCGNNIEFQVVFVLSVSKFSDRPECGSAVA